MLRSMFISKSYLYSTLPICTRKVPRVPKTIREGHLIEDALEVIQVIRPKWIEDREKNGVDIKTKMFTDGITNKLFGIRQATAPLKEMVMVKVYGEKTDLMIDREQEIITMTLLHMKKCGAQLYALFENGICYEFIPGTILTMETCRSPEVYPLVATEMARIHKSIPVKPQSGESKPSSLIWKKMRTFYTINEEILHKNVDLRERLQKELGYNLEAVKNDINELESILEEKGMPVVFCHNDTPFGNVIYNEEENHVRFIDFEYALPNYGPYDIANHFMEFAGLQDPDYSLCPHREFRSKWISHYLKYFGTEEGGFTQEQFERWVELCIPLSDLYWSLWCVIQAEYSTIQFDFVGYIGLRYVKYKKHMKDIRANTYMPA